MRRLAGVAAIRRPNKGDIANSRHRGIPHGDADSQSRGAPKDCAVANYQTTHRHGACGRINPDHRAGRAPDTRRCRAFCCRNLNDGRS